MVFSEIKDRLVTLLHDIKGSESVVGYLGHTSSWDDETSHIEAPISNAVQKCRNLPCILLNAQRDIIEFFLVVSNSIAVPINGFEEEKSISTLLAHLVSITVNYLYLISCCPV